MNARHMMPPVDVRGLVMAYYPRRHPGLKIIGLATSVVAVAAFVGVFLMPQRPSDAITVSSFVAIFVGMVVFAFGEWMD